MVTVLNNSVTKQSHGFSKQERFPSIKNATLAISPASYKLVSQFDTNKIANESFKVKEARFRYYESKKRHGNFDFLVYFLPQENEKVKSFVTNFFQGVFAQKGYPKKGCFIFSFFSVRSFLPSRKSVHELLGHHKLYMCTKLTQKKNSASNQFLAPDAAFESCCSIF